MKKLNLKKILAFSLTLAMTLSLAACSASSSSDDDGSLPSDYPKKNLEIIVPFAAGGGADIAVRLISKYAEEYYGQSIVISNVTGGSGVIGRTQMVNSDPDGYTIGFVGPQITNDQLMMEGIQYDFDSYAPVAQIGTDTHVLIVSEKLGVDNVLDLLDLLESNPGAYTFGIGGSWTSHEFLLEKFVEQTGADVRKMPFDGGTAAVNAVASGDCDIAAVFISEGLAQIQAGNVIALGVTYSERVAAAPDIPTLEEEGFPFYHEFFRALAAPAETPDAIIDFIRDCYEQASQDPAYIEEATAAGLMPSFIGDGFDQVFADSHAEFEALILGMAE